jgi:formylglycine-generating enzyme required for sulfatase activity
MMHLNVVRMLETSPCTNCLKVEKIEAMGDNRVQVTINLRHPFSSEHKALTGFDVRGIVMLPGSYKFPTEGVTVSREDHGDPMLMGPDGYTRLFNPKEFPENTPGPPALHYITGKYALPGIDSATLNPYLIFAPETERNYFPAGANASRTYDLKLPPGPIELGYAVDASWYPVQGPVVNVPDDFPLSANSLEAWRVFVSIGKGLTPTGTGTAKVRVEVFDWQGVDTIDKVLVEAPQLFGGQVEASLSTIGSESAVYYASIQNINHAAIGDYPLLVTVKDKEQDPNLGPLSAYQIVDAHVTLKGVWIRELVHIPAGDFIMGSDPAVDQQDIWKNEQPQHVHPTGEYYIGRFEISNEEYAAFIADDGYHDPEWWSTEGWTWRVENNIEAPNAWNQWPNPANTNGTMFPDIPTGWISWFEAEAFCTWAGGRLPTEPEWEKAGRGTDGRIWPWGNTWDVNKCDCNDPYAVHSPAPVGSYSPQGDSPYGISDAIGDLFEYTSDWMDDDIYGQYATGDFTPPAEDPKYPGMKVARGGSYGEGYATGHLRLAFRGPCGLSNNHGLVGFRIVFDP